MGLHWVKSEEFQLAITTRPRGDEWLEDDLRLIKRAGADVLVSALTSEEEEELGLKSEKQSCADANLMFVAVPIVDRSVPVSSEVFGQTVDFLHSLLKAGKGIVIHCRAGIGRSSIIAACLLIGRGCSPESAFHAIQEARGCSVPDTVEQREWVKRWALSFHPHFSTE